MPRNSLPLRFAGLLALCCLVSSAAIGQINACQSLIVADFSSDPYAIAQELRSQARKQGFTVISSISEVSQEELLKTCVMRGSWSAQAASGRISVRVLDASSGELIAEAATGGTSWWGVSRTVRKAVEKIYSQLGYTGFNQDAYQNKIQRLYPSRPKLTVTEEQIKKSQPKGHVEGIWSDLDDKYRLGIVPAPAGSSADYVGVVLRSNSPVWQPGEIKAELRSTASPEVFTCTYFMANKKPVGTTFVLDHEIVLHGIIATPNGQTNLSFLRVWPKEGTETGNEETAKGGVTGTGFLLNNNGLLATNWHVVGGFTHITFTLPGWGEDVKADVLTKDAVNDLAIIRATNLKRLKDSCPTLPYQLISSNSIALGQHVSTIGYPLTYFLGANPKFSEGVVSSKSGLRDDPREFQISAQIQPGSSGGPLFDSEGNVIGIIVATLLPGKVYEQTGIVPQNVNYAIKSDYLLSLMSMLSAESPGVRNGTFSPERASQCVAFIHAW